MICIALKASDHWAFRVPTINYWGKDKEGACQLLQSATEYFVVQYSVKEISDTWGPGEYTFKCGSNTSECGCTFLEKKVTIFKVEITALGFTGDHDISQWPPPMFLWPKVYGRDYLFGFDIPVWTQSGKNDPVCYTKNSRPPQMFTTLAVSPYFTTPIMAGVSLRARDGVTP